ncbi:hypothetical protein LTR37_017640 [Vermiconidia calcicola]|uniref:Uncharacterized protein n=1 Tax=Vermiconidia calcicola TaxID=1690605 RepID=A0ACC3MJH8_9PEZI|nr:hypothetical protein LTR37_017640 [Vermiconidia calcicola]
MSSSRRAVGAQRRMMSDGHQHYEAVVVGSGPAGITCVGNLLERKLAPILWVDDGFDGGRVNKQYREVPSNTKVKTFIDFAEAVSPFRRIIGRTPSESNSRSDTASIKSKLDRLQKMRDLDPEKGCRLSYAADMCLTLTEGLKQTPEVATHQGRVAEAVLDENPAFPAQWAVRLKPDTSDSNSVSSVLTKRLVLCTGSSPNNDPLPIYIPNIQVLDLDAALSPTQLSQAISPLGPTTIAVIGASHSAVLVLMNLYNLAASSKPDLRIRWLTRHPLRYAEFMDGWILRDNTGLKGEAADWAKANLEPDVFKHSDVSKYMSRIDYDKGDEEGTFEENLQGCNFYVQAIGYSPNPLPMLKTSRGKDITPYFDNERGTFNYVKESDGGSVGDLARVPGLYGAGIAWPERVRDPHGNVELAVGFWKFMKFVKRVSPEWN